MVEEIKPSIFDTLPPLPSPATINALWFPMIFQGIKFMGRMQVEEGTYFVKETTITSDIIRGEIRFYRGAHKRAPLFPGDAYMYYDIDAIEGRIVDIVVQPALRRHRFAETLVKLAEARMKQHYVELVYGTSLEGALDFWRAIGYTVGRKNRVFKELL